MSDNGVKNNNWFRKTTWSEEDQADFFAHLEKNDNPFHAAQYVRIQALHLQDAGVPRMLYSAIKLIDLMIEKYPHKSQLAMAHMQKAECLDALGHVDEAIQSFRDSLDAQRSFLKAPSAVALSYGTFAVNRELAHLYDEVFDVLEELSDLLTSPAQKFQHFAIKAVISEHRGDLHEARGFAREAINATQQVYSGTHYDKQNLELVEKPDSKLHRKVIALAGL